MATLAEQLDAIYAGTYQPGTAPVSPAAPPPAPAVNTQGWWGRTKDYLANTDWGNLAEAMYRVNPITGGAFMLKDALTEGPAKAVANQRLVLGQLSRFPTDVASGVVGLYPGVAAIRSMASGEPMSGFAQTLQGATEAIDEFGRSYAEPIAGRSLAGDDAGSLLRGTAPEMAGQWARLMSQALVPVPTKIAGPILMGANAMRTGIKAIDTAGALSLKTIEALTPLAVSSAPSAKTAAVNLIAQGTLGPFSEAAVAALMPAREATAQQDQATQMAQQGSAQATAGKETATGVKPDVPATPQMAGFITGDTPTDLALTATVAGAALFAGRKSEAVRRVTQGINKAVTGYDVRLPDEQSVQSTTTKIKQQYSDRSASLGDTLEKTLRSHGGFSEDRINDMVGRYREEGASRQGAGLSTKARVYYDTGQYMDTNVRSKPMNDQVVEHAAATPAQQKAAAEVQWSMQELDLRERALKKGFHVGQGPIGNAPIGSPLSRQALFAAERQAGATPLGAGIFQNKYAYNLYDTPSSQLDRIVTQGMADPVVRNLVHGYRDIVDKANVYMAVEKRQTAAQARKFKQENPNYIPPRAESLGAGKSYIDPRNPVDNFDPRAGVDMPRGVKTFEELGNPMENLPKYMDEVFRSTEGSKGKRDFILTMQRAARAGNAYAQQIMGRDIPGKPGADAANRFVSWRDLDGNLRYTEIKDAVVRDALRGVTSPTALQLQHGLVSAASRWYESGAVGAASLAGGTVFAPKSALYAATIGTALNRPKGVSIGLIDKLTQTHLGFSTPGIDGLTTMPLSMALHSAKNIGTVMVERGARILHNSVLKDGMLTKFMDPATLKSTADAMYNWYRKTAMYDMQRQGLMSPGSFMSVDPSLKYSNPAAALQGKGIPGIPGSKLTGEVGSFVNDILHAISSSPAMAIMAQNKNVPKWKVASAIRNLSGDPGAAGAFRNAPTLAKVVQATPWGNIYVQSATRLASSFAKNPVYTTAGLTTGIAIPAIMATAWNNEQGPEYTKYQYFERTPDQQASSIYIAMPGRPPNEGLEIPVDPLTRWVKYIGEGLAGLHFGAFTGEMWKPENEEQRLAFKDMINHRMAPWGDGSVGKSLFEQSVIPPVPGLVQGAFALGGVQLRSYVDARTPNAQRMQGFAEGTKPGGDSILDHVTPGLTEDVFRSLGAQAGGAVFNFFKGIGRDTDPRAPEFGNVTKTLGQALGTQFKEWKQHVSDSTSELGSGPLFNTFRSITPSQEAASQAVKVKLDNIKAITKQYQQTTEHGAPREMLGNKKIGREDVIGAHPAQPNQLQGALASDVNTLYKQLQQTLQQIKVHYTQSESIKNSNQFTPNMKRALREEEAYKVIDLNRRMLQDIQRAERVLSQQYGTKIDFSNLKLQGGQ